MCVAFFRSEDQTVCIENDKRPSRRKAATGLFRLTLCAVIAVPVLVTLSRMIGEMDHDLIRHSITAMPPLAIIASVLLTILSFIAVARYDDMALRLLGHRVKKTDAIKSGFIATSLSQSLGFGFFVGTVARWRCYRHHGLTLAQTAMVSGVVIAGFMTGFAIVLACAAAINPQGLATLSGLDLFVVRSLATGLLLCAAIYLVLSLLAPRITFRGWDFNLPPIKVLTTQVYLAAFDVIPAALALWVLIPTDAGPTIATFVPVYLMALGLGLMSNAPGGIGVLEMTCLMALPVTPPEHLLAALIVHRVIYFGIPVVLALALLVAREIRGETDQAACAPAPIQDAAAIGHVPLEISPLLAGAGRAETALAFLGDKSFLLSPCRSAFLMCAEANNSLIMISDPVGPRSAWPELVAQARDAARARFLSLCFYRVSQDFADVLTEAGFNIDQIGSEALVPLEGYSTAGPEKRELRRKLKQAAKAGVAFIHHPAGMAPLAQYRAVSARWSDEKGGERGFSMGFFDPDYIQRFASIEARQGGVCLGFVTVWMSGDGTEAGIDVMRICDDAPAGTMQGMVHAAAEAGAHAGASVFSLASVPFFGIAAPQTVFEWALAYGYEKCPEWHGAQGLYRFKNAFRPEWAPRYVGSLGPVALALGLMDTARLIHNPQTSALGDNEEEETPLFA